MPATDLIGRLANMCRDAHNLTDMGTLKEAIRAIDPTDEKVLSDYQLEAKYTAGSGWGEHPWNTREEWRREVADENTQLGYWAWVHSKVQD
ncbi:hypothetical protein HOV23_gp114 [Pseudomonas phage Lana]|uniref:Uncharacterized protein n=1 Tax=Pseudomonas phage Lana TaxID=2530172 RepID=A0A481W7M4_9CAUD|nr:hypothetical protein HOV23_gp114 [Pseudomonas phage Lana]QBJ04459.1 hypothetical protein [Pseudomonas phage Lana]